MTLARYQAFAVDAAGNVLPEASISIRSELTGTLVPVYTDRAGTAPKGNPFQADADGYFFFHATGGAYRVTATLGSETRTFRYVAIGLAAETDGFTVAVPSGSWDSGATYGLSALVRHGSYLFISRIAGNLNNEPDDTTPDDTEEWMYAGPVVESSTSVQSPDESVENMIALTQSAYDALDPPAATTFYIIKPEE